MSEVFDRIVTTREAAHEAARLVYANAQAILLNDKPARITCVEHEDDRTLAQNAFYWGACLREISEQATILGQRYTIDAWHELFKRQFLGYEVVKVRVAGRKKPTIIRRLKSTRRQKVKAMSAYLDKVQAFATSDLGVCFSDSAQREYAALVPAAKKRSAELATA